MTTMPVSQITPDQDAMVTEIEIAAPPERVFEALTDPAQLMLWWAATPNGALWEMDARPGREMAIRIDRSQPDESDKWSTRL